MLVLVAAMQLLTTPVAAHMVGRAAYRTGQVREDLLRTDELTTALEPDDDTGTA
jgi:multicomponent Na+:H+ antiporter subunit G